MCHCVTCCGGAVCHVQGGAVLSLLHAGACCIMSLCDVQGGCCITHGGGGDGSPCGRRQRLGGGHAAGRRGLWGRGLGELSPHLDTAPSSPSPSIPPQPPPIIPPLPLPPAVSTVHAGAAAAFLLKDCFVRRLVLQSLASHLLLLSFKKQ